MTITPQEVLRFATLLFKMQQSVFDECASDFVVSYETEPFFRRELPVTDFYDRPAAVAAAGIDFAVRNWAGWEKIRSRKGCEYVIASDDRGGFAGNNLPDNHRKGNHHVF